MADEASRTSNKKVSSGKKAVDKDKEAASKKKHLEASIRSQVAAEEKAHQIVEQLVIERSVDANYLLEVGNYITPSHYSDVIEERGIAKLCGYPLCTNSLTKVLEQKYKICVRTNRVFDISERKYFCSNQCYKASKYFESQIPTSPVWTRLGEQPKPFTILESSDHSQRPGAGNVLVGSPRILTNQSDDVGHDDTRSATTDQDNHGPSGLEDRIQHLNIASNADERGEKPSYDLNACEEVKDCNSVESRVVSLNECQDQVNKKPCDSAKDSLQSSRNLDTRNTDKLLQNKTERYNVKDDFKKCIKETLKQWFSPATYQYLCIGRSLPVNNRSEPEIEDNEEDTPNFAERAIRFLTSNKVSDDDDDNDDDAVKTQAQISSEDITITEREPATEEFACIIPLIDCKSQLTIRRKIVLQKLTHCLPEMLATTQHSVREIETHFTHLVKTFRLSSHNVMFRPHEWRGLATTLLCLLQEKLYPTGDGCFPSAVQTVEKTVTYLGLAQQDMNEIINWLKLCDNTDKPEVGVCPDTPTKAEDTQYNSYSHTEDLD